MIRAGGGLYYGPGQFEDLIQPIESDVYRSTTSFTNGIDANTVNVKPSTANPVVNFAPRAYDTKGYNVLERIGQYGPSIQQSFPEIRY